MSIYTPILNHLFLVEIVGIGEIGFFEIENIEQCINVVEYREGDYSKTQIVKIPGLIKYGNIILKKGIGTEDSHKLIDWFNSVKICHEYKKEVTIQIKGCDDRLFGFITLYNAWPIKYKIGNLNALGDEILLVSLELTFESLDII